MEKFPNKAVYAGRTDDDSAAIAVAVLGDQAAAYLCDGQDVEAWFRGTVEGDEISLTSKRGAALEAKLVHGGAGGQDRAGRRGADLHHRSGGATGRDIPGARVEDHHRVDRPVRRLAGGNPDHRRGVGPAPELDPDDPEVTVDGEQLQGEPVSGDQDV